LVNVKIEGVRGSLTDHYDPNKKILRLSHEVYQGRSIASIAVAAHESGYAVQDQEEYFPLRFHSMVVPIVNVGSYLGWILIILGLLLGLTDLAALGVAILSGGTVIVFATLPVEINASTRAKRLLSNTGLITTSEEQRGDNTMLSAASLTYDAALFTAIVQLLYWVSIISGFGGRRR